MTPRAALLRFAAVATGILLVAVFLLAATAHAAPVPGDGPRFGGTIARDKTLLGFWYYDSEGAARFAADGELLETNLVHALVYAPLAPLSEGAIRLNFTWEEPREVQNQTVVDGELRTTTETVWATTKTLEVRVAASSYGVENTEIPLPTLKGQRLRVTYAGETVLEAPYSTAYRFHLTPRETTQAEYEKTAALVGVLFAATLAGAGLGKLALRRMGYYPRSGVAVALAVLGAAVLLVVFYVWPRYRDDFILQGVLPLVAVYLPAVAFASLEIWSPRGLSSVFARFHPDDGAPRPKFKWWWVTTPREGDERPPSTGNPNDVPYYTDSKADAFLRLLVRDARSYLRFPPGRRWNWESENDRTVSGLYVLKGDLAPPRCAGCERLGRPAKDRPHFAIEPRTGALAWVPRVTFHREVVREVPLSAWAINRMSIEVVSDLRTQAEAAEELEHEIERGAALDAALKAGTMVRARSLLDAIFLRMRAVRTGAKLDLTVKEHYNLTRKTQPLVEVPVTDATIPDARKPPQTDDPPAAEEGAQEAPAP